jgi:hypothetical protein
LFTVQFFAGRLQSHTTSPPPPSSSNEFTLAWLSVVVEDDHEEAGRLLPKDGAAGLEKFEPDGGWFAGTASSQAKKLQSTLPALSHV